MSEEVVKAKHQIPTPSSREIPESKHQKPSSKYQRNPKFQAPNHGPRFELGIWGFSGVRSLGLGPSLEFGVWSFNRRPLLRRGEREKILRRTRSLPCVP